VVEKEITRLQEQQADAPCPGVYCISIPIPLETSVKHERVTETDATTETVVVLN
jgi:hypothetical protein